MAGFYALLQKTQKIYSNTPCTQGRATLRVMFSFHLVVLGLCIVSVCEHVKFGKKITTTNGANVKV